MLLPSRSPTAHAPWGRSPGCSSASSRCGRSPGPARYAIRPSCNRSTRLRTAATLRPNCQAIAAQDCPSARARNSLRSPAGVQVMAGRIRHAQHRRPLAERPHRPVQPASQPCSRLPGLQPAHPLAVVLRPPRPAGTPRCLAVAAEFRFRHLPHVRQRPTDPQPFPMPAAPPHGHLHPAIVGHAPDTPLLLPYFSLANPSWPAPLLAEVRRAPALSVPMTGLGARIRPETLPLRACQTSSEHRTATSTVGRGFCWRSGLRPPGVSPRC